MTFIFYDTETTGTDTTFDQILQIAAVRTDGDLNIVDRLSLRCRLLPFVVPSPGALLVTRTSIDALLNQPLSHFEMMRAFHRKMRSWCRGGAIFLGWNSLHFDEHLLRQAFYQSLLPAYLTNSTGNGRGDVMRMVQVANALQPSAIAIPLNETGNPTFRLGAMATDLADGPDLCHQHVDLSQLRDDRFVAVSFPGHC